MYFLLHRTRSSLQLPHEYIQIRIPNTKPKSKRDTYLITCSHSYTAEHAAPFILPFLTVCSIRIWTNQEYSPRLDFSPRRFSNSETPRTATGNQWDGGVSRSVASLRTDLNLAWTSLNTQRPTSTVSTRPEKYLNTRRDSPRAHPSLFIRSIFFSLFDYRSGSRASRSN